MKKFGVAVRFYAIELAGVMIAILGCEGCRSINEPGPHFDTRPNDTIQEVHVVNPLKKQVGVAAYHTESISIPVGSLTNSAEAVAEDQEKALVVTASQLRGYTLYFWNEKLVLRSISDGLGKPELTGDGVLWLPPGYLWCEIVKIREDTVSKMSHWQMIHQIFHSGDSVDLVLRSKRGDLISVEAAVNRSAVKKTSNPRAS